MKNFCKAVDLFNEMYDKDYKQRNEKAIEYIEEQSDYISSKSGTYYMCYAERNIVLDILKGDKDE